MELTPRVRARIERDFEPEDAAAVAELLGALDAPVDGPPDGSERICAAILVLGRGDVRELLEATVLAQQDWRDLLVTAGLGEADWRARVDEALASSSRAQEGAPGLVL